MRNNVNSITNSQARYYGNLFETHGAGVDAVASGSQLYKELRYEKLCRVFENNNEFSMHDVGFGLGHLWEYIKIHHGDKKVSYSGSEVTDDFVVQCRAAYPDCQFALRDLAEQSYPDRYDYLIFGGTFYHTAGVSQNEFKVYVQKTLKNAFCMARRGIAFNFVTSHVEYRKSDLFYMNPADIIEFVVGDLSRFFLMNHSYPLFEYTMCVYQEEYVAQQYASDEFAKYFKLER
jgi:hypothetical protein